MARSANNLKAVLTDTANAIKTKKGSNSNIIPRDFADEISSIQTGTDTSDATATANDILLGKTAYVDNVKISGNIPTKTQSDLEVSGATVTTPSGYYASNTSKSVASGSVSVGNSSFTANPTISVNTSTGVVSASVSGSTSVSPTVSAGYVSSGTSGTISVSGSATQNLTTLSATTYTPGTVDQTIPSGQFLTGTQTIKGDANLIADNIKKDVTILGVTGNYEGSGGTLLDYTATFVVDSENYAIMSVNSGTRIPAIGHPSKAGYTFKGWGASAGATTFYTFPYLMQSDTTFYAVYIQATECTVANLGSSSPSNVTFTVDSNFSFNFEEVTLNGNVFIKIPTMYRKIIATSNNQITRFAIANGKIDDSYVPYSCFVDPNGNVLDYILIGKYMSSDAGTMNSVNATYVTKTLATARSQAQALGTGYQLYDWQMHKLFQDLTICYLQSVNTNSGSGFNTMLGIAHQKNDFLCDGIIKGTTDYWWVCYDPTKYVSLSSTSSGIPTDYVATSYIAPTTTGEISKLGYDANNPFVNMPTTTVNNSYYNTYYCDLYNCKTDSHPVLCNVGYAAAVYGVFSCDLYPGWSDSSGVRLCYRPL